MFKFKDPVKFSKNFLALRQKLNILMPPKIMDKNLMLGTWNIRNFSENPRLDESYAYMTEIVSRYDILAIQELKSSLEPLNKLKKHLGSHWQYVVSHPCMSSKGNFERMAFLYDTRRVQFSGISSVIDHYGSKGEISLDQFSRSPYMAGFQAGDFKFFLCNVHLYYDKGKVKSEFRRLEIKNLLERFGKTHWRKTYGFSDNFIVLGDFNIPAFSSTSYQEVNKHNFSGFDSFLSPQSNQGKLYDQVLFSCNDSYLEKADHGRFEMFDYVYRADQESFYRSYVKQTKMTYTQWRTYQLSDHNPLWVNIPLENKESYWTTGLIENKKSPTESQEGLRSTESVFSQSAKAQKGLFFSQQESTKNRLKMKPPRSAKEAHRPYPAQRPTMSS